MVEEGVFMNSKLAIKQLKEIERLVNRKTIRLAAEDWKSDYEVLISTILSAQTKDETTIRVCDVLFSRYPTMESLARAREATVLKIIKSVNYNKTKTRNIIGTARILKGKEIPDSVEELIKLPGVGRKVANVYLAEALKADAIGVDTHVGRISQKMGWSRNKNPHKIEKDLERLFPKKYWRSINYILVNFGRVFGRSRKVEDEMLGKLLRREIWK